MIANFFHQDKTVATRALGEALRALFVGRLSGLVAICGTLENISEHKGQ
jgi:hypothetical protein